MWCKYLCVDGHSSPSHSCLSLQPFGCGWTHRTPHGTPGPVKPGQACFAPPLEDSQERCGCVWPYDYSIEYAISYCPKRSPPGALSPCSFTVLMLYGICRELLACSPHSPVLISQSRPGFTVPSCSQSRSCFTVPSLVHSPVLVSQSRPCALAGPGSLLLASQIKKEARDSGDLGLVAQKATASQKTLSFGQKIPALSARDVRRTPGLLPLTTWFIR